MIEETGEIDVDVRMRTVGKEETLNKRMVDLIVSFTKFWCLDFIILPQGLPPPVKLESCHITCTVVARCKTEPKIKIISPQREHIITSLSPCIALTNAFLVCK